MQCSRMFYLAWSDKLFSHCQENTTPRLWHVQPRVCHITHGCNSCSPTWPLPQPQGCHFEHHTPNKSLDQCVFLYKLHISSSVYSNVKVFITQFLLLPCLNRDQDRSTCPLQCVLHYDQFFTSVLFLLPVLFDKQPIDIRTFLVIYLSPHIFKISAEILSSYIILI